MRKTLGDYNIEKSSSSDVNNINWSQKKSSNDKKPKKKKIVKNSQIPPGTKYLMLDYILNQYLVYDII